MQTCKFSRRSIRLGWIRLNREMRGTCWRHKEPGWWRPWNVGLAWLGCRGKAMASNQGSETRPQELRAPWEVGVETRTQYSLQLACLAQHPSPEIHVPQAGWIARAPEAGRRLRCSPHAQRPHGLPHSASTCANADQRAGALGRCRTQSHHLGPVPGALDSAPGC